MSLLASIRRLIHLSSGGGAPAPGGRAVDAGRASLPVLETLRWDLQQNGYDAAVLRAYPAAVRDMQQTFGLQFSPGWTDEELMRRGFPGLDRIARRLRSVYEVYAPIRFGPPQPGRIQEPVEQMFADLYSDWLLHSLVTPDGSGEDPVGSDPSGRLSSGARP
jgi:hypothetical protein